MTDFSSLHAFGWDAFFNDAFRARQKDADTPARVVEEHKNYFFVESTAGRLLADVAGKVKYHAEGRGDLPAVGDWVVVRARPGEGRATIREILPRKTKLARKTPGDVTDEQVIAANVDTVFVTTSLNNDFNLRRLERCAAMIAESRARGVVLLNKADLVEAPARFEGEVTSFLPMFTAHALSAATGFGLEALTPYLGVGRTLAIVGSSGVGKSTLANRLAGADLQTVREAREGDDRGRHTTTSRRLISLPAGALLIDTPGLRELQLWTSEEGVTQSFPEIEALSPQCRFRDCKHEKEAGCAVLAALTAGTFSQERFDSFRRFQKEAAFLAQRREARAKAEHKNRPKKPGPDDPRRPRR
jgi:ribosome biogenesis GTPase